MPSRTSISILGLSLLLILGAGCENTKSPPSDLPSNSAERTVRESWSALFIQGKRAGYLHSEVAEAATDREPLLRWRQSMRLSVMRAGQPLELTVRTSTLEDATGGVREFQCEVPLGASPIRLEGQVEGDELRCRRIENGQASSETATWSSDIGGFFAVEQSLRKSPMQPGEQRAITQLQVPPLPLIGEVQVMAEEHELTALLAGQFRLLRIRYLVELPDHGPLETILWANHEGEVLKTHTPLSGETTYRTTREIAMSKAAPLDLERDLAVRLDRPLPAGLKTRRAVYDVVLSDGDPAEVFPSDAIQQVKSTGEHAARVSIDVDRKSTGPNSATESPTSAERESSALIQSDDPTIEALARKATGEQSGWDAALVLERLVHQTITAKDYSQVFASAAEVLQTRQGDCTEHAVLLAALCRAEGIPARLAMGLVYLEAGQRLAYHMWTEVWVDGRWRPLDATLGQGGIGAGHLKLATSALAGEAAYTSLLPVLQVVGRLKISLVEAE